jgi:hypothetical protein
LNGNLTVAVLNEDLLALVNLQIVVFSRLRRILTTLPSLNSRVYWWPKPMLVSRIMNFESVHVLR